jgi:hypothetical protein
MHIPTAQLRCSWVLVPRVAVTTALEMECGRDAPWQEQRALPLASDLHGSRHPVPLTPLHSTPLQLRTKAVNTEF